MQEYRFEDEHSYLHKLQELVDSGVPTRKIHAFSPIPVPAAEQILREKPTFVRVFAIAGALMGMLAGFALCIYTVLRYPMIVSGKPVVAVLPFVVIAFELTILLGSLATFAGFLLNARLPYIPRIFNPDEYGTHFTILVEEDR
ncbi:MAG: DUF3341 domain-containing protein [Armatimonadota bacterium]|jgi:molybdopterin-containing oxidoreductase family membrane subunit